MWAPMRGFPSCLCTAATSMAQPVRTAAWLGTPTVPGMATPARGSTRLGSGEYQMSTWKSKETSQGSADVDHFCGCFYFKRQCKIRPCGALQTAFRERRRRTSWLQVSHSPSSWRTYAPGPTNALATFNSVFTLADVCVCVTIALNPTLVGVAALLPYNREVLLFMRVPKNRWISKDKILNRTTCVILATSTLF